MSLLDGFFGLGNRVNTVSDYSEDSNSEGVVSETVNELELSMSDDELITLKKQWEAAWLPYAGQVKTRQDLNELYWLGQQFVPGQDTKNSPIDNLIFESLETFLPMATRQRAEPVVDAANTPDAQALANSVRKMLIYQTDNLKLNLKIKQVVRYWSLYMCGVMKVGWSNATSDITCVTIRPQKLILDPDCPIFECEYTGDYIGEYRKDTAQTLVEKYPNKAKYITSLVNGKMGTKIQYIEWWTNDYVFWTLNDEVLAKNKNPHWVYDNNGDGTVNHFPHAMMPYVFLSVFSLGLHPFDDTNLIEQNLSMQDLINKRLRQIDKNADKTNGGLAVSGDSFTMEQAATIGPAVEKGGTIFVPSGDVNTAVGRLAAPPLPSFVYESLVDYRNEVRNIFGTRGSTAQGTVSEQTVRGKMLIKGQDADRIGGGVSIFIEQFADRVYNWFTQLMYVYYDEAHSAAILGQSNASEYITLKSSDFITKLSVSVKEGSMLPRDPLTRRNEAIDLWGQGAIDPISLFERLDFPNPLEAAKNLFLWKADPMALFNGVGQPPPQPNMQMGQPQQQLPPQPQLGGMEDASLGPVG